MSEFYTNFWGWTAGVCLWLFDHWSGLAALILFGMQFTYQAYRIKLAKKECEESEE